jgi:hypothetical protein
MGITLSALWARAIAGRPTVASAQLPELFLQYLARFCVALCHNVSRLWQVERRTHTEAILLQRRGAAAAATTAAGLWNRSLHINRRFEPLERFRCNGAAKDTPRGETKPQEGPFTYRRHGYVPPPTCVPHQQHGCLDSGAPHRILLSDAEHGMNMILPATLSAVPSPGGVE